MSIKIFPYSLVRYAGLNCEVFDQFTFQPGKKLIERHQYHLQKKDELKNTLCDALFPIISEQTDDQLRQQLINIKRKIFNNKKINVEQLALLENLTPTGFSESLQAYTLNEALLDKFFTVNEPLFAREIGTYRQIIQQMALKPELQNGLMLSSPVLYTQLTDFIKKDPEGFKQKELRMEFSLLRYLSRMAFKTSPFSSFTYTGIMIPAPNSGDQSFKINKIQSRLKLNNILFEYLCAICKQHPILNEYLILKINITTAIKEGKIQFLTNFNNVESFQQLIANGIPILIINYLQSANQPVTLEILITYLLDHLEHISRENLKAYLIKLISTGLLEFGFGFSGMDENWDVKLLTFFESVLPKSMVISPLINLFRILQLHRDNYAGAKPAQRYQILQQAENEVNGVFLQLQKEAKLPYYSSAEEKKFIDMDEKRDHQSFLNNGFVPYYFSARNIFYEDCFTKNIEVLPEVGVANFVSKTNRLAENLLPLDVMRNERVKMRDFYLSHYPKQEKVKVVDFYRDYYFYVKKPEKVNAKDNEQAVTEKALWKAAVLLKLQEQDSSNGTFNLTADFFSDLPVPSDLGAVSSIGAFVQFYQHEDQIYGVINSLLPGMGKVSGRFLSLFDSKIQTEFIWHNEAISPDVIKAELNDASTFNANIHPALLKQELSLPSGNNIYPIAQQIKVSDLSVCLNADSNALELIRNDQRVYSYDLSLESFYNRSNLYQLLAHFNPDARISLQPFIQLIDQHSQSKFEDEEPDIYQLPEIIYEETVVIRRKTWRIKTAVIPVQQSVETDFEYFIYLNSWLELQKIPRQIFLFLRKRGYQNKVADGVLAQKEGLQDDYKPQYIAFDKPVFVIMFKRLLARAGNYITIEEVLPVPAKGGVKEYLIQWYNG